MHEFVLDVGTVVRYPFARDLFFHVRNKVYVGFLGNAHVGVLGYALQGYDLSALTLERGFDARAAAVERFGDVDSRLNVRRATL